MKVKFIGNDSLEKATVVVKAPSKGWWVSTDNMLTVYPDDYLIVEDVTVVKSAVDTMMDSAAAPATAAMTVVQAFLMTVSIPQAFLLLKILQTMDFYIYINCLYPSNFAKFLDMITNSVFDYIPNFFKFLIDAKDKRHMLDSPNMECRFTCSPTWDRSSLWSAYYRQSNWHFTCYREYGVEQSDTAD